MLTLHCDIIVTLRAILHLFAFHSPIATTTAAGTLTIINLVLHKIINLFPLCNARSLRIMFLFMCVSFLNEILTKIKMVTGHELRWQPAAQRSLLEAVEHETRATFGWFTVYYSWTWTIYNFSKQKKHFVDIRDRLCGMIFCHRHDDNALPVCQW